MVGSFKGDDAATRKRARGKAEKLNQEYGRSVYKVKRVDSPRKMGTAVEETNKDHYDLVLEYLLDEGFCESQENAEAMVAHMSEEWISGIIEANGYEKENKEKPKPRKAKKAPKRGTNQDRSNFKLFGHQS